ncbi:unnamed protein product [Somion occarium]|uniref:MADS-box domain-containing protein n=1 Tax=Somion occarium TaxID=3059160 RepID=A0ABP1E3B3_9APHY
MGRRKIEIQPITHERNRSVTFLKRKNGLFKKAYELGVLCSVDVAVIIFEERPGHHVKLYQYCSGDVNNIVQRHLRFEGERDTKGPHDFSGVKAEDVADEDEDGDEDDGSRPKMNGKSTKPKIENTNSNGLGSHRPSLHTDLSSNMDIDYRSSNTRGSPNSLGSPNLPISGERLNLGASNMRSLPMNSNTNHNNKRPRLAPLTAAMGPSSAGSGGGPTYPYRLEVDLNFPPSGHLGSLGSGLPPHGAPHPSLSGLYSHNGLMNSQTSPGFVPPFDFSRPTQHQQQGAPTLRSVTFPSHSSGPYANPQQQTGVYQSQQGSHRSGVGVTGGQHVQNNSLFADLLDSATGDHHSGHHQSASTTFSAFDWPVHNQQSQAQRDSVAQQPTNDSGPNWLDFLSGPSPSSQQQPQQQSPSLSLPSHQNHSPGRPASNSVSSTRSNASYTAITPAGSSMESMSPSMLGRKRSRGDDDGTAMSVSDLGVDDGEEVRISGSSSLTGGGVGVNGKLDHAEGSPGGGGRG